MKKEEYSNHVTGQTTPVDRYAEIEALVARYFEAETTDEEESRLRRLLCSPEGQDPRFDEVRAVLGFLAVGRQIHRQQPSPTKQPARRRPLLRRPLAAAAAIVTICLAGTAVWTAQRTVDADRNAEVYIAYIGNRKITDKDIVMREMHNSLAAVTATESVPTVEEQLEDMFDMLNQE